VSAAEGRTVDELLDDSDGLAREALLDMSADRALGMVRGWPQLMRSAAEWAVLPPDPTISASADPIAISAAMGRAVDRSLTAGHWPERGPRDEAWEQIASNFVQARRILEKQAADLCGPGLRAERAILGAIRNKALPLVASEGFPDGSAEK
jgi:hypothetical protein